MGDTLVINHGPSETRVALLSNGVPVELYVERDRDRSVVGNVYRGRVVRVLPGMQAAFVEVGLDRTGFLYVDDAVLQPPDTQGSLDIGSILKSGQEVMVQVQKEPIGTKGARLTRQITVPGRNLVYMPFNPHIGVSRRIEDEEERERLREILQDASTEHGGGFIVRTAAEGIEQGKLVRETQLLHQMWHGIERRGASGPTPSIVFEDLDLVLRATRDLFTDEVDGVVADSEEDYQRIRDFVASFAPGQESRVQLHDPREPVFDHYGIEVEIERALERRVWLKSGGYIVIDQAEALTVVDVNSGRFVGKSSLEDTITQINLEAVKEVVYQLRLRNIGGIVIIDFIDMASPANREKVLGALEEALKHDKAKTTVVRMSEIGLVELTRKRVRESLGQMLTEPCPDCKGRGFVKSEQTVASEVLRAIARQLHRERVPTVLVNMNPGVADYLYAFDDAHVDYIERLYDTSVVPVARQGYHREHFEIVPAGGSEASGT
ncbi:MAG: Rne/Rng family ribonuclease [Myxococcota bacterium]